VGKDVAQLESTLCSGLACTALQLPAMAANTDGPPVFWKVSLLGNARALTNGMATLSNWAAEETDGKFQIKILCADHLGIKTSVTGTSQSRAFGPTHPTPSLRI
jgi:TRAP-type mannitol/chloroaromatic compound transport system substrate-binding protein